MPRNENVDPTVAPIRRITIPRFTDAQLAEQRRVQNEWLNSISYEEVENSLRPGVPEEEKSPEPEPDVCRCGCCERELTHYPSPIKIDGIEYCHDCVTREDVFFHCGLCTHYFAKISTEHDYYFSHRRNEFKHACKQCVDQYCTRCTQCNTLIRTSHAIAHSPKGATTLVAVCHNCHSKTHSECQFCDGWCLKQDSKEIMLKTACPHCYDVKMKQFAHLGNENTYKNTMGITRAFGVEIECIAHPDSCKTAESDYDEEYIIPPRFHSIGWEVDEDGSLPPEGEEHRSPISAGDVGLKSLHAECEVLRNEKYHINSLCGLHVHINAVDLNYKQMLNIAGFVKAFEHVMYSLLPKSRRDNTYCRRFAVAWSALRHMQTHDNLAEGKQTYIQQILSLDRYSGLNLQSFFDLGSIEFRYHSGTLDYEKIKNWILLCLAIVERNKDKCCTYHGIQLSACREDSLTLTLMCKLLKLSPELTAYLKDRQEKFNDEDDKDEDRQTED